MSMTAQSIARRSGSRFGILISVLALVVAACSETPATETTSPEATPSTTEGTDTTKATESTATTQAGTDDALYGGTLRYALAGEPPSLDPMYGLNRWGTQVWDSVYEQLFIADVDGTLHPRLGESFEMSDDGLTLTVTVPDDVMFHNGEVFDASAVVAHFQRAQVSLDSHCIRSVALIASIEAVDSKTVVFEFSTPHPEFPALTLAGFCGFIPAPGAAENEEELLRHPVGTGPFQFVEWNDGRNIVVERFEDYRRDGLPYLDGIEYSFIPDTQTQIQSIRAGDIDVVVLGGYEPGVADSTADINMESVPVAGHLAIRINNERAPFDSAELRCAAAYATDLEVLSQVAYEGLLPPAPNGPLPVGSPLTGELEWPSFDPERAREIIAESGPIEPIQLASPPYEQTGAQLVQQMWESVGFVVEIRILDPTEMATTVLEDRTYQAAMYTGTGIFTPGRFAEVFETGNRSNFSNYSDPEVDALFAEASEQPSLDERYPIYQEIWDILAQDCPEIHTAVASHFAIYHDGVNAVIQGDPFGAKKFVLSEMSLSEDG